MDNINIYTITIELLIARCTLNGENQMFSYVVRLIENQCVKINFVWVQNSFFLNFPGTLTIVVLMYTE